MIYFTILISLTSLFFSIRIFKISSPINFFGIFNVFQLITYLIVINSGDLTYYARKIAIPTIYDVTNNYFYTCYLFIFFSIINLIFCFIFSIKQKKIKNSIQISFNKDLNIFIKYINILNTISLLILFVVLLDINLNKFYSYTGYLNLNDFDFIEADLIISKIFLVLIPFFGIISSLGIYFNKENKFLFYKIISFIIFITLLVIALSKSSRLLPLLLIINFSCFLTLYPKKNLLKKFLLLFLIFISYLLVLELRDYNDLGLSKTLLGIKNIFSYDQYFILEQLSKIFYNLSQGAIIFDLTLNFEPYYEFRYKILSIIPSISYFDNFNQNFYFLIHEDYRLNKINPFNSFGEAYLFGSIYFYFYIFIFLLCIFYSSIINEKITNNFYYLPVLASTYFIIIYSTQYNLRNVSRYIYISLFSIFIFNFFLKKISLKKVS